MIKQLKYLPLLLAFLCIYTSCSTQHYVYSYLDLLPEHERQARVHENYGEYEEAIEVYRQQIEANPNQFQSVLYQHKIMLDTEALSDPFLLADEAERTLTMLTKARDDNYEDATPEAINKEHDALEEYIREQSKSYYLLWQKTTTPSNAILAIRMHKLYTQNFPDADYFCSALFHQAVVEHRYADFKYWNDERNEQDLAELTKNAINDYNQVVEKCEDKLDHNPEDYLEAAKDVSFLIEKANRRSCPSMGSMSKSTLENFEWDGQEETIPDCRLDYIEVNRKYMDIALKYNNEEHLQYAGYRIYESAEIYFNHYQFDKAIPLFKESIEKTPEIKNHVILSAYYILESYRIQKKYKEMLDAIHEFKNNTKLMSTPSTYSSAMSEFLKVMKEYEKELNEKFADSEPAQ